MRTYGLKGMLSALTVGLLLILVAGPAVAQETQPPAPDQGQAQSVDPDAKQVKGDSEKGFTFHTNSLMIGALNTNLDTQSARFQEYRDYSSGSILNFNLVGEGSGDRLLEITANNARRDDARYTLNYGKLGRYSFLFDYNKVPHNFGNNAQMLFSRTGPGTYSIPAPTQAALQSAITNMYNTNRNGITFNFLNGLVAPYLAAGERTNVGLERDRTLARLDLGKMGQLHWNLEYTRENRAGTRPYGASFGFSNVTELPEPIDYDTNGAQLAGEWNTNNGGLRFGYQYSSFRNRISTMYWDNPFRLTSATDASAYSSPGSGSIGGSAVGFADLAPDNQANLLFVNGRSKFGRWFANGSASYNQMRQDDPLLPYTLNGAIVGLDFNGSKFDPTLAANLPARTADRKVNVSNVNAQLGTNFGQGFGLTFHYRYYDYDNGSKEIEFPGYVRFHAVWEDIARVAIPYSYKKQNAGAELGWDLSHTSRLALTYDRESWDRTFRETKTTDEDILKLSFDTHPIEKFSLRASYEIGDRSLDHYDVDAAEATFAEPESSTNIPSLRRFDQAARKSNAINVLAQVFATEAWNFSFGVNTRNNDYDKSAFGLQKDDVLSYNAEVAFSPSEKLNFFLFGQRSDRDVRQKARQSGATPSTNPLDDWTGKFNELNDTWGLGLNSKIGPRFTFDLSSTYSKSNGNANLFSPAGGTPDLAVGFDNYEDIKLFSAFGRLGYQVNARTQAGLFYRWEDYTLDSFIFQGLTNYLPGALLLDPNFGDYNGKMLGIDVNFKF